MTDALSSILRSVRLGSSLISRAKLTAPWGVHSTGGPAAIFHAIVRGQCWIRPEGQSKVTELGSGDVVVLSRGAAHTLFDDPSTPPAPRSALRPRQDGPSLLLEYGGGGAETRIICGTFSMEHDVGEALLASLPAMVHVAADPQPGAIDATLRLLDHELGAADQGSGAIISRLLDVLVVQIFRQHLATSPGRVEGWLAAVHDQHIGRALALVHGDPAGRWSAAALAARVGMSRTRFFERFTELVGEPPARYVARRRVNRATELMRGHDRSTAEIAELVGYASEDAFTKVFKRHVGVSPSAYRRRIRSGAPAPAIHAT
jgi:AraC-like DNA-binding protein